MASADMVTTRLGSVVDMFYSANESDADMSALIDFNSQWQDLLESCESQNLDSSTAQLAFSVADTIEALCEMLLDVDVSDTHSLTRLQEGMEQNKAGSVKAHSPTSPSPSRDSSPTPSASSSRQSSPSPSRRSSPRPSLAISSAIVDQQSLDDLPPTQEEIFTAPETTTTASPSTPPTLSSRVRVPPPLTTVDYETDPSSVAGPSTPSASSRSPSPSPSTNTLPPTPTTPTPSPAYIQPILEHLVANPYNPYPHKSFLTHVASSTSTPEKDVNTYLRSLRSKLGWNRIQKRYFPKPQWTQWQMIAWLEGLWHFEHLREPSFEEWDKYQGPEGLGGKMKGLDAELGVLVHELKNLTERRQGPTEVAKVLDQVNWEEFVEKKNLKRKAEEDETPRHRVVSEPTKKRARSESEEAPNKKRSRSESPDSDDGTPPPPSKRHCSLPTMSLSIPPELTQWKTSAWVPPAQVSLNTFSYDRYAVPVLVDDDSEDGSERGSVGPSTPETADHLALPSWDFSSYVSQPQPPTLNVSTLPEASFPELLNLELFSPSFTSAPMGKDNLSTTPAMDHYIPIQPLADDLPFEFDSQAWSFNYDSNLDLSVDWSSLGL